MPPKDTKNTTMVARAVRRMVVEVVVAAVVVAVVAIDIAKMQIRRWLCNAHSSIATNRDGTLKLALQNFISKPTLS